MGSGYVMDEEGTRKKLEREGQVSDGGGNDTHTQR